MVNLPSENFTLKIGGVKGVGASVTAYDPIQNRTVSVKVSERTSTSLTVVVPTTDYPYLLTIQNISTTDGE
jgi:hypothetical protein